MQKEPDNTVAAAAGIYAFIEAKEFDEAERLVDYFIPDRSKCTDENDIIFTAASKLYEAMGKKKEKSQINKAMKEYEEYLEQELDMDFDDEDEDPDWDLPFD